MGAAGHARRSGFDHDHRLWLHDIDGGLKRKTAADGIDGAESAHRAAEASASLVQPWGERSDERNGVFVPPPVELVR